MIWTAAKGYESCRGCDRRFARDEPMALLTSRHLMRCAPCVSPEPVDWDAVHQLIAEREAQRLGESAESNVQSFARVVPGSLNAALKDFGIKGIRRVRPQAPKPYAEVADHPDVARNSGE